MKLNKAFIFVTGASYFALSILASFGYPTMTAPVVPISILFFFFALMGLIFVVWGLKTSGVPSYVSPGLALFYGLVAAITFVGFESWGGVTQNVAMAAWDLACALCFAVE